MHHPSPFDRPGPPVAALTPAPRLTAAEARRRAAAGALLLDVRTPGEWRDARIPGAAHLPLADLIATSALAEGPLSRASLAALVDGRQVVVICRSGRRSQQAASLLVRAGVDAADVVGGLIAWAEDGLPVVRRRTGAGTA
ncbi:rhodanese-like domain-containing protein [Kitasatospora sp. NPDC004240]